MGLGSSSESLHSLPSRALRRRRRNLLSAAGDVEGRLDHRKGRNLGVKLMVEGRMDPETMGDESETGVQECQGQKGTFEFVS
jgi:hypothetical protein